MGVKEDVVSHGNHCGFVVGFGRGGERRGRNCSHKMRGWVIGRKERGMIVGV